MPVNPVYPALLLGHSASRLPLACLQGPATGSSFVDIHSLPPSHQHLGCAQTTGVTSSTSTGLDSLRKVKPFLQNGEDIKKKECNLGDMVTDSDYT